MSTVVSFEEGQIHRLAERITLCRVAQIVHAHHIIVTVGGLRISH